MIETWKPVTGYEGRYEVSNTGKVKSLKQTHNHERILKPYLNKHNGYVYVCLYDGKKSHTCRVHVLVMAAFSPVNKKPGYDKNFTIDHKDGNKSNNFLSNLEWCSQSENQNRAYSHGLQERKGTTVICLESGEIFNSYSDAARSVGGNTGEMVARVCRGERSHYREYHFAKFSDYQNNTIPAYKGKMKKKASASLWR